MNNFLAFDLSGTGTTSCFDGREFRTFKSKDWKEHANFIKYIRKKYYGFNTIMIYEQIRPNRRNNEANLDLVNYAKLLGFVEFNYKNIFSINSFMTKDFRKKIRKGEKSIPELVFKTGKGGGWFYKSRKIIDHEVDALIIYFYGSAKFNNQIYINNRSSQC